MKCPKCRAENPETARFCLDCGSQIGVLAQDGAESGAGSPDFKDLPTSATKTLQFSAQELATGATFAGRYQVIEELGAGGMGRVYKVFDQEVQAKMALKLIRPEVEDAKKRVAALR
jgi:serine/threonine-protein kinase